MHHLLSNTMKQLLQKGKGILAADESIGTIGKRFDAIGIENTEKNRRDYRLLLATTNELEKYIHGVILFEETFHQSNDEGISIPALFEQKGIVPGIKIDKGLVSLPNTADEKVTQGLDGLEERLKTYQQAGARFAKWRNVYTIGSDLPSRSAIETGAETLARYAASCQSLGIVPIVEPEVLMDGEHSIKACEKAAREVLQAVFQALIRHNVDLNHIVLKPSMVTAGKSTQPFSSASDIACRTLAVFRDLVPASVPSINFLSGGQSPQQATANLNAINSQGTQPWLLSFSYGRALQEDCLAAWKGQPANQAAAQESLLKRAYLNSMACFGEYRSDLE